MQPLFELDLTPISKGARDGAASLYRQLRAAILEGRLAAGSRLPPTRQATARFGVSRNTASEVYERLLHDGLVTSRHGSGTFVARARLDGPAASPAERDAANGEGGPDPRLNPFWTGEAVARSIGYWGGADAVAGDGSAIDLRPAVIDPGLFPFDRLRQSFTRQLRRMETRPARLQGPHGNQGNFHLRRAIADHVALTRAVACRPEDVLVTSGAQQAFDLIARVLVEPGRTVVAVEEPGYPPMRAPFAAAGAAIHPVACDEDGLRVDLLPPDAQVVCITPSHQFPLGVAMSTARRQELLDVARRTGAAVVEDDYDGEFRYEGSPLTALRTADAADVVFYVGTFSKAMLPSLRLGFLIAPAWAREALIAAKNTTDWHASSPLQQGVAGFMNDGHLARHVLRMRKIYSERRGALLDALAATLPPGARVLPSPGGMHVTLVTQADRDMEVVSRRLAAEHRIQAHGLERFFAGEPTSQGLVLGFGTADKAQLARAAEAIGQVLGGR